jgi:methylenetetrahydrofolate--tRNA-(uracil-5-)-methyltransferase
MRLRSRPHIRFAGQITGVEGYVESAAMGLLAGRMAAAEIAGPPLPPCPAPPRWARLSPHHRRGGGEDVPADEREFRPLPPARGHSRRASRAADRYKAYTDRAKADWQAWLGRHAAAAE